MTDEYRISELNPDYEGDLELLKEFLEKHELRYEADIEVAFGIFDQEERLCGCGCGSGSLLKCFAVDDELRGQNALGSLVSRLIQNRFSAGLSRLFIITRSHNEELFKGCGFHRVSGTDSLVMMENRKNGPEAFAAEISAGAGDHGTAGGGSIGAVVMNCNPFTLGHRHLIEYASSDCDLLYVFVVEEDRSLFPTEVRLALVREGTLDLSNVRVVLSGHYMISSTTFPTYFLKDNEDAPSLYGELDASIFAERIAPALGITRRYAGEEPLDRVTAGYNQSLSEILRERGIEFKVIPRREDADGVISASRVRDILERKGLCPELGNLLPKSTLEYLKLTGGRVNCQS